MPVWISKPESKRAAAPAKPVAAPVAASVAKPSHRGGWIAVMIFGGVTCSILFLGSVISDSVAAELRKAILGSLSLAAIVIAFAAGGPSLGILATIGVLLLAIFVRLGARHA